MPGYLLSIQSSDKDLRHLLGHTHTTHSNRPMHMFIQHLRTHTFKKRYFLVWSQSRKSDKLTQPALSKRSIGSSLFLGAKASQCLPSVSIITPSWTQYKSFHKFRTQKEIVWAVHRIENTVWYACWHSVLQIYTLTEKESEQKTHTENGESGKMLSILLFIEMYKQVHDKIETLAFCTRFHPGCSSWPHIPASIPPPPPTACEPPPQLWYLSLIFCCILPCLHFWSAVISNYTIKSHARIISEFSQFGQLYFKDLFQHLVHAKLISLVKNFASWCDMLWNNCGIQLLSPPIAFSSVLFPAVPSDLLYEA